MVAVAVIAVVLEMKEKIIPYFKGRIQILKLSCPGQINWSWIAIQG